MAYVYKIIFKPTNQYYIGFRGSKNASPEDLLISYFTSSKVIKQLIKQHGIESFSKEILVEFENSYDAYEYEQKLLKKHNVESNDNMLNKRLTSCALDTFKKHTKKTRKRMSESRKKIWENEEFRKQASEIQKKRFEDLEYVEKRNLSYRTNDFRLKKKEDTEKLWKDPKYVKSVMDAHKKATSDESYKKWHSDHKRKLWQDPEYRKKQLESRKKSKLKKLT
jgi:hypothetical protein